MVQSSIARNLHFNARNFPDLSGNIPTTSVYGTYISQVIRYTSAYHNHGIFSSRHCMLADRLFNQGISAIKLMRTFYKEHAG